MKASGRPGVIRPVFNATRYVALVLLPSLILISAGRSQLPTWTNVTPATGASPSPRIQHAMAYDSARDRVVLFGGLDGSGHYYGDTWEWDGSSWAKKADTGPSPRNGSAMVYDAARGRVVLFGGGLTSVYGDTWEWDGTSWTPVTTTDGPAPRTYHAMAYDAGRGRVVLYGGAGPSGYNGYLDDTWEWDGAAWSKRSDTVPSRRAGHKMAYDAARGHTVLFGGTSANETWEWDGTAWSLKSTVPAPGPRYSHAMDYDLFRGSTVLFGGQVWGAGPAGDTWVWDGASWAKTADGVAIARRDHAMAYDSSRGQMVLFGGGDGAKQYYGDTWVYGKDYLAFHTQPEWGLAGQHLAPQPVVEVRKPGGFVDNAFAGQVTISIKPGTGSSGAVLGGTTAAPLAGGVAPFTDLSIDKPGEDYVLVATCGTLPPLQSQRFGLYRVVLAQLVFTTQPDLAEAGKPCQHQPIVLARDASNVVMADFDGPVTLGIKAGTGTPGAVLIGSTTAYAVNGVVAFTDLGVDRKGTGYVLEAFVGPNKLGESAAFNVSPKAERLVFTAQPDGATDDWPFTSQPVVSVVDADGETATLNNSVVTLTIKPGTGTAGAALNGTRSVTALHGTAGYSALAIPTLGHGYVLSATSPGFASVESLVFDVQLAPKLLLRQRAANEVEVSLALRPAEATMVSATVALSWKASDLGPVASADIHPATGWSIDYADTSSGLTATLSNPGTNVSGPVMTLHLAAQPGFAAHSTAVSLTDTSGLTDDGYNSILVLPRNLTFIPGGHLAFTVQPTLTTAGGVIAGPPAVAMLDGTATVVADFTGLVTMTITPGTGTPGAILGGKTLVDASAGVSPFSDLTIDRKGKGYAFTASSPPFFTESASFDIAPKPSRLVFLTQPGGARAGLRLSPQPVVEAQDGDGDTANAFTLPVTVDIVPGTGFPGTPLGGAKTLNTVAGVATSTDLHIDTAAPGYQLEATSDGLTPAMSAPFDISPFVFLLSDVSNTLQWAGGQSVLPPGYLARFDVVPNGKVDIQDAVRIARKVAGLEPNP